MQAQVATRCIFLIDNPALGRVALVTIGMTEISSCTIATGVQPGSSITKGQELGAFNYGGSSAVVMLRGEVVAAHSAACEGTEAAGPTSDGFFWDVAPGQHLRMGEVILDMRCPNEESVSSSRSHWVAVGIAVGAACFIIFAVGFVVLSRAGKLARLMGPKSSDRRDRDGRQLERQRSVTELQWSIKPVLT